MKKTLFFLSFIITTSVISLQSSCKKDPKLDCSTYNSTYNSNMKAIIDNKCKTCHVPGGSAETYGDYTTYATMKPNFAKAWEQVELGKMPQSGVPQLTTAEKEAFECWKNAGFPQ